MEESNKKRRLSISDYITRALLLFTLIGLIGVAVHATHQTNPKIDATTTATSSEPKNSLQSQTKSASSQVNTGNSQPTTKPNISPAKPYSPIKCTSIAIPFSTEYRQSSTMYVGESQTFPPGINGQRRVCTADSNGIGASDTIVYQPHNAIITTGTKPKGGGTGGSSYTYAEALQFSISYCNGIGATSNTSAYEPCISAKLKTYGY